MPATCDVAGGVDEMFRNRHEGPRRRLVESAVRAAGGFPTQGGGVRALSGPDRARHQNEVA